MDIKITRNPSAQAAVYHPQRPPKAPQPSVSPDERAVDTVEISKFARAAMARETGLSLSIGRSVEVDSASSFLTDEKLSRAAESVTMARLRQLPRPEDCVVKFSPEFERSMDELIRGIGRRD